MARTLITGGTVVNPTGAIAADVLVDGETIAALYAPGVAAAAGVTADRPSTPPASTSSRAASTRTPTWTCRSAARSPPTTSRPGPRPRRGAAPPPIIDFGVQTTGEIVQDRLAARHEEAAGNCAIDYGFHMILGDVDDDALKAMDELVDNEGVTSFKLFMAYPGVFYSDDGQILRAMQSASNNGATIMMHAENGIAIDVLAAQAVERGETDPVHHGIVRRSALEGEATHRAIVLADVAGNVPLYIVHLSASEALEPVAAARDPGRNVFAETCPQYLYLTLEDQLGAPGFEGAKWVCSPPLRTKHEHHHADLWNGLRTNDLAVVSTDHCPFCFKDQKELGVGDFRDIPNGMAGVEHRMDLIYQGVVDGKLSLERWVETCSTTPARMFGLYPRKGIVAPGSDADLVVYDPGRRQTISHATPHMNVDHSSWEGFEIDGRRRHRPLPGLVRHRCRHVHGPGRPRPVPEAGHERLPAVSRR